jgi:hypothetical protein
MMGIHLPRDSSTRDPNVALDTLGIKEEFG